MAGKKNDGDKPAVQYIPTEAIFGMGKALGYGAKKYEDWNYTEGLAWTRLTAACIRHVYQFLDGIEQDDESGLSHIDHALASLAMLKFMIANHPDLDDRHRTYRRKKHANSRLQVNASRRKRSTKSNKRK